MNRHPRPARRPSTLLLWFLCAVLILTAPGLAASIISAAVWTLAQPALVVLALVLVAAWRFTHPTHRRGTGRRKGWTA